jgi:hypothetical protein
MDICARFKYTNGLIFSPLAVKRNVIGVYMKSSIAADMRACFMLKLSIYDRHIAYLQSTAMILGLKHPLSQLTILLQNLTMQNN